MLNKSFKAQHTHSTHTHTKTNQLFSIFLFFFLFSSDLLLNKVTTHGIQTFFFFFRFAKGK